MTDEELKNLRTALVDQFMYNNTFDSVHNPIQLSVTRKRLLELITAEQNRRAVRSEDVQNLIDLLSDNTIIAYHSDDEGTELDSKEIDLIILALEAYQPKNPCVWCKAEYTIIDDDFGQPLHPNMVKHCFKCGRALKGEANG